jgi:hypothetical protein
MGKKTTASLQIISAILSWLFTVWLIYSFIIADKLELSKNIGSIYWAIIKFIFFGYIMLFGSIIIFGAPMIWLEELPNRVKFFNKWDKIVVKVIIYIIIFGFGVGIFSITHYLLDKK